MNKILFLICMTVFWDSASMKRDFDFFMDEFEFQDESSKKYRADLDRQLLMESGSCGCQIAKLIDEGADVNARDELGRTPLIRAVGADFREPVCTLIAHGADLNACDSGHTSALHYAVAADNEDLVKILLDAGARIDIRGIDGIMPLMAAAQNGFYAIAQLLISRGANVNERDYCGWTPLLYAVQSDERDIVSLLLAHDADVQKAAWNGTGARALLLAAQLGNTEIAGQLIGHGADLEVRNAYGWTALGLAVSHGRHQTVELLLERGAEINRPITAGQTALAKAVKAGHEGIVTMLLGYGADYLALDVFYKTPLQNAIIYQKSDGMVRLLLEWVPEQTVRQVKEDRNRRKRTLLESHCYAPELIQKMIVPIEQIAAQQHLANLETDELVRPVLKKFDLAALQMAIERNVFGRLDELNIT